MLVTRAEILKIFVRIANRVDPDQPASSKAVRLRAILFVEPFRQATPVQTFRTSTLL